MKKLNYDTVVVGAGAAGIGAAISAAKNGAKVLLVESSSVIGGDLISGLPIDGCITTGGEWIVGGVLRELLDGCDDKDGYVGAIYDRRNIWVVMVSPNVMGFVLLEKLAHYGVSILPYTQVDRVSIKDGGIESLHAISRSQEYEITANTYLDCTGDGELSYMCGVPYEMGGEDGELQPMTMVFHIRGVDPKRLLSFVLEHPENCGLGENPNIKKTAKELAQELYDLGIPKVFFSSKGPLLSRAIANGELNTSMLAFNPNAKDGTVLTVNTTRISKKDCIGADSLGSSMLELTDQVRSAFLFIKNNIPGCEGAVFDGIAPRLGVRESRRILGEYYLKGDEVAEGIKREDGVAKGGHEIDVHGSGTNHIRKTIKNAGSYDIPLGCMKPLGVSNLLMAGRCISSDRVAHSSARVMGTCLAMGEAVGLASAIGKELGIPAREVPVDLLRQRLKEQGAILEGTN